MCSECHFSHFIPFLVSAAGTTFTSGGSQTIRVAAPGSTVLKAAGGTQAFTPGSKQIITVHKAGNVTSSGASGQPQIVTLVKTSQGMTVATVSLLLNVTCIENTR